MPSDPFDDEGEAADARALALTSILIAHGRVSLDRAVADLDAAHADALEALYRLQDAQAVVAQWIMRLERAAHYAGEARDNLCDQPCSCLDCRARWRAPKKMREDFTRHALSDLPLLGEADES